MSNTITMRYLGKMGRFGNQILQYAFLRCYADQYDLEVQTAPWAGEYLFGIPSSPVQGTSLSYHERWPNGAMGVQLPPDGDEACNRDFVGYAQYPMGWYAPYRHKLAELFSPTPEVADRMAAALEVLGRLGNTLVGVHLRRGDYGRLLYYRVPVEWYLQCLHDLWPTLDKPVLFVATQEVGLVREFIQYDPIIVEDLGVSLAGPPPKYEDLPENVARQNRSLDFFPDWYLLNQCDVLLTPNSTFSFTAGMVSTKLKRFFRSHLPDRAMKEQDIWAPDMTPLEYYLAEDYRDVPGLCLTHNPPHWYRCPKCEGAYKIDGRACPQCRGVGSTQEPPPWYRSRQQLLEIV